MRDTAGRCRESTERPGPAALRILDEGEVKSFLTRVQELELAVRKDAERSQRQGTLSVSADLEQVRAVLPPDDVLVELRELHPYDFTSHRLGEPHLLGMLLSGDPTDSEAFRLEDLGLLSAIRPSFADSAELAATPLPGGRYRETTRRNPTFFIFRGADRRHER